MQYFSSAIFECMCDTHGVEEIKKSTACGGFHLLLAFVKLCDAVCVIYDLLAAVFNSIARVNAVTFRAICHTSERSLFDIHVFLCYHVVEVSPQMHQVKR